MDKKRVILIVALIMALVFSIAGICSCACITPPRHIAVDVSAPLHTAKGEEFTFEVSVQNKAERPQLLYSIDISDEYLDGIAILRSEPPFTDCYHVPIDNTQCYEFKHDIPPGDELIVTFYAVALDPGEYSSYLDVCINTATSFVTHPIVTIVED